MLRFTPEAAEAYRKLAKQGGLLHERVRDVLDALDQDPGQARLRTHRFSVGVWAVQVRTHHDEWLVIWEGPDDDGTAMVRYIGPEAVTEQP